MEPNVIYEMECPKCSNTMFSKDTIVFKCSNNACGFNYINFKRLESYNKFESVSEPLPWKPHRPIFVEDETGKLTHRWHYGRREWMVI